MSLNINYLTGARRYQEKLVHFLEKVVSLGDTTYNRNILFDALLPSGSLLLGCYVYTVKGFDAQLTNTISIGANASNYNDIVEVVDVGTGKEGQIQFFAGGSVSYFSTDTPVYIKFNYSGNPPSNGKIAVALTYIPANFW